VANTLSIGCDVRRWSQCSAGKSKKASRVSAKQAEERGQRELSRFGRDPGLARNPDYKGNGLQLEFTVEDDGVFTKPWSAAVSYRRPLGEWPEMVCVENPNEYFHGRRDAVPTADKPDF